MRSLRLAAVVAAGLAAVSVASSCSSNRGGYHAPPLAAGTQRVYGRAATFVGPITAGHVIEPESAHTGPLPAGYLEQEFFASGTASAFTATAESSDGRWSVAPSTSAPYETRVVVRRPANPSRFNGTVVVEWLNVSAGESNPDWDFLNPALADGGFAYVGVSAQALGVDGGQSLLGSGASTGLVRAEPARYGALHHPGDQYALDIFAQIGRGLRLQANSDLLGGSHPRYVVGVGESQSAFYLTTFANAVQPVTDAYDGLFIHSRGGAGIPVSGGSAIGGAAPAGQRIRTDLKVPVFMFETETDVVELGYASARQPDTRLVRTWEVAGTAHADTYVVGAFANELGCPKPINDGPQHSVVQAAFASFARWVTQGTPPSSPPPLTLSGGQPVRLALDANGNALGGVRTPAVDVPVSTLSGLPPAGAKPLCSLFGSTTAFSGPQLARLYHDRATYLSRFTADLGRAISGGFILPASRQVLVDQAQQVDIPSAP